MPRKREKRLHSIWRGMKNRCGNPNAANAKYYHDKGVKVCKSWQEYERFERWALKNGYKPGLSLDRKNTDGNYSPQNCKWVPWEEQVKNKSNIILCDGEPLKTFCEREGLKYSRVQQRVKAGWSMEDAITR